MKVIPCDTLDLAYTVPFFRVGKGGAIKLKLLNGQVVLISVKSGELVNLPVRRVYHVGTTAGDFQTDPFHRRPVWQYVLPVPFSSETKPYLVNEFEIPVVTENGLVLYIC